MIAALLAAVLAVGAPAPTEPVRVRVVTANVLSRLSRAEARADVHRALAHVSVGVTQENHRPRPAELAPPGWSAYQPAAPRPCRENVVYWRDDVWKLRRARRVVLHPPAVGFPHAQRCASVAILRNRATGLVLPVVGLHMIPGVERRGHPRPLPRVAVYGRAMDRATVLADALRRYYGLVLIGADWNVDYYPDARVGARPFPWRHLHRRYDSPLGVLPPTVPTLHRRRWYDVLWANESRRVRWVRSSTILGTYSDHDFARAVVDVRPRS